MATWISIGSFKDLDPTEGNFVSENAGALLGTFAAPDMSLVSTVAHDSNGDGIIWEDDLGGGESITVDGVTTGLDSVQSYIAIVTLADGTSFKATLGVAQLLNGECYILPTDDTHLDELKLQSIEFTEVAEDNYDGMYAKSAERSVDNTTVVCFAAGTLIETPEGPRAVEDVKAGDQVMTLDHGAQIVRWTRKSTHPLEDAAIQAKPVEIKAGALAPGRPFRDLIVSPQHRILVGEGGQLGCIFAEAAFAPAKSLTRLRGVRHMKGKKSITWIHFACDRHEIVIANGCLAESLLLGPMVLDALDPREGRAVRELFGGSAGRGAALNGPPARDCLTVAETEHCIAAFQKNQVGLAGHDLQGLHGVLS